jgi:HSP20 family molecular chaperone IbpA
MVKDDKEDKHVSSESDIIDDALGDEGSKPVEEPSSTDIDSSGSAGVSEPVGRDVRRMVEDIVVTPFFKHHGSHMPATIKLHAELREEKGFIVFESSIPGFEEDEVKVDGSVNSINVSLLLDKREGDEEEDVYFHSSFVTPKPINHERMIVEHKDGVLRIKAPVKE